MIKLLFELFVIYILYKLIFDFIIPVYKTTKQVQQKVNEMNQRMQQNQAGPAQNQYTNTQAQNPSKKPVNEDYIDYEEVK